jgi:two-component system, sensor histidine kinase FlrB
MHSVAVYPSEDEKFLLHAFRSFAEAADSLERSYGLLRSEVEQLRRDLEDTNADLTKSLEENRSIRAHLDRILESLPCGVLVVSSRGEITRANPEARRLLGAFISLQDNSLQENPLSDDTYEPASSLPLQLRQLIEHSRQNSDVEQEFNLEDESGTVRWLAARQAFIYGNADFSVVILRDISERKRLEAAQARLGREQALAEMSAVLAHEIRNPLASLELFAGLLADSTLDREGHEWVEQVQAGLRTLAATVNNVLHFHSLPEPQCAPIDLGQLLDWAGSFFEPLARQARVTLSSQNRLHGIFLSADRHRLEQVLLNLVLNAIRAMPGGGWIEIGGYATPDGQSVLMRVADTGPGITAEHLPHLFDPGFSTRASSPGLGLAVCRKIVEQHEGIIRAESRPGRGASFTLTLPLHAGKKSGQRAQNWNVRSGEVLTGGSR